MIPTVEDLRSAGMTHRYGDLFNPPGLTNFLGSVQVEVDPLATRSLLFPPLSGSGHSTGALFIDGKFFLSTGSPITFTWWPDRIVRETQYDGMTIRSTTVLPFGRQAVGVLLEIENPSERARSFEMRIGLRGGVTEQRTAWTNSFPPAEYEHDIDVDPETKSVRFLARDSGAAAIQGTMPRPDRVDPRFLSYDVSIAPRDVWRISFVHAIGSSEKEAMTEYEAVINRLPEEIDRTRQEWNAELEAMFTPGSDRYSGSLPVLETSDADILRIYHTGAIGVAYFKRESPHSVIGRAYDTLMPRYWSTVTYLWDYSLSSLVHALLDPHVMKGYLQRWMKMDIHSHFGTEWLTGSPVGPWYSVNDYAMTKILNDYVRWTGDTDFLKEKIGAGAADAMPVIQHLESFATNWTRFRTPSGLADYGGINNLLECVSTYVHEVASLNAANAWNLRVAADILEATGESAKASEFRDQAAELVKQVNGLYEEGAGYWNARFPDGSLVPVRHCYDFFTVINSISQDLSAEQLAEMVQFFVRELQTPVWMRALSPDDPDSMFSDRPDHQWNGAYTAWPAQAVTALWKIGETDRAYEWLRGLALSANQGPFGQAHFDESVITPESGGARKAPSEFPWINDWACSSNGSWVNIIIESIFGVDAKVNGRLTAEPKFGPFDKDARLRGLSFAGKRYDVDRNGITPSKE